jgi:hypothetical protein
VAYLALVGQFELRNVNISRTLYITRAEDYTPEGSKRKKFLIASEKRNLLSAIGGGMG